MRIRFRAALLVAVLGVVVGDLPSSRGDEGLAGATVPPCGRKRTDDTQPQETPRRAEFCQIDDDDEPVATGDASLPVSLSSPQSTTDLTTLVNTIALTLYLMNPTAPAPPSIVVGPLPPTLP
jgi:hypothetical protein